MIDYTNGVYVLAVLAALVAGSEWLVRKTAMKYLGTALLVIVLTAIIANLGILPTGSTEERPVPVYNGIFQYLAPISIFWLLLRVSLRDILRAGLPLVILFCIGSLGTTLGIVLGMWAVDASDVIGPQFAPLGGMFVGTYTGGSVNFNAVALEYDMVTEPVLYSGSVAADNIITTLWMIVTLSMPVFLRRLWPKTSGPKTGEQVAIEPDLGIDMDTESMHPMDLGITLSLGLAAWWISEGLTEWTQSMGFGIPSILIITILALILAQFPWIQRLKGAQLLGMFSVYVFLAVIGAFCDLQALSGLGRLGLIILGFAGIGVLVHGLIIVLAARLMRMDPDMAAVASQANVGGGTSALALARSRGRTDLVLPAVLLGSLGNALGTFLGFWAAEVLLPMLA